MKFASLTDKAFAFTAEKALFSAPSHLIVAVSGGPDSMALLHILQHWPQEGLQLDVVHVNHGLRGKTAQRDENFVREYCETHNLNLTVFNEDVASYSREQKISLEEAGRILRYQRFESVLDSLNADYIVTAHTAADQVETMLMHLLRGCGTDGLCGIPAKRDAICRPLLTCTRDEILDYCREFQVPYVLDETNEDCRFMRNHIRHKVMPVLRDINPAVEKALLRLQSCAEEDVNLLNQKAQEVLDSANQSTYRSVSPIREAARPLRLRAVRLLLRQKGIKTIQESHLRAIDERIMAGEGSVLLPGDHAVTVEGDRLYFEGKDVEKPTALSPLWVEQLPFTALFGKAETTIRLLDESEIENVYKLFVNRAIDCDKIQGKLHVRSRIIGDYLRLEKRGISKSLKKLMQEWNIPARIRVTMPLLCDDNGVLLVPGYGVDARVAVTETTKRVLVWE